MEDEVELLRKIGFKILEIKKFSSTEYYRDLISLKKMLEIITFRPIFSMKENFDLLMEYEKEYKTYFGLKSSRKRILIISAKSS